ncbi:MAG: hypothetical protein KDD69_00940, partial [Bdellovibrionales bacterium]|nr:hypothetical protein [Bdellovibrionales bacterium]
MYASGYAMCPWAVSDGVTDIKVLGFPVPDTFPEERWDAELYAAEIRQYMQQTRFTKLSKFAVTTMLSKMKELLLEDDGALREDWLFEDAEDVLQRESFRGLYCMEQIVAEDAEVCVIGTYSAQKRGLVQDLSTGGLQILPGGSAAALHSLRARGVWYFIFSLMFLAAGSIGSYYVLQLRETRDPEVVEKHEERFLVALEQNDLLAAEEALARGISPNLIDPTSSQALLRVRSVEMLRLLTSYGLQLNQADTYGNTPLAAAFHKKAWPLFDMLLAAGADPNDFNRIWQTTAAENAYDRGQFELYDRLLQLGGKADVVPREAAYFHRDDPEKLLDVIEQ